MNRYINFSGMFLFVLIALPLLACTQKPAVIPATNEGQPVEREKVTAKQGWEAEWEQVQKEARKEGRIVLFTGVGTEMRQAFAEALKEYGLELVSLSGRGGEMVEKMLRERKAGIYNVDFYISGHSTIVTQMKPAGLLASLEPLLILPEVKDPRMWYKGELPFVDKEKTLLNFSAYPSGEIHVNTDLVKPGDINSLEDLLSPRWQGKIIMDDPTVPGRGNQWAAVATITMGEDFIRQLAKQKPLLTRDKRQQIDWVAKGRYPVGISVYPDQFREYKKAGAPVGEILLKNSLYLTAGYGYVVHIDRSPRSNASRVFLNWLLSKKGQMLWDRVMESQSARVDVPADHLKEKGLLTRQAGVDYLETLNEAWVLETKPRAEKVFIEAFAPLLR